MGKLKELNTTTNLVKGILEEYPDTRNSDNILYVRVCEHIGREHGININKMSMPFSLLNLKDYNMPQYETVGRCRRKLQAEYPELQADANVEAQRELNETDFKAYARGYC